MVESSMSCFLWRVELRWPKESRKGHHYELPWALFPAPAFFPVSWTVASQPLDFVVLGLGLLLTVLIVPLADIVA